ncbi:MAG: Cell division protein FtsI [Clostridiales bacterium 38_11]|nr:MAG: Cell division protein FtsI [Clostridiales bacterium 38_11]HBH12180.1 stage V sporulation protein D [Clostridiales bacterium]
MTKPNLKIKKRIIFLMFLFFISSVALVVRLGNIQIIEGEAYKKEAFSQWSRDITINASRGTIYDSKGKKLAVSIKSDTVVCFPRDVMKSIKTVEVEEKSDQNSFIFNFLNMFRRGENDNPMDLDNDLSANEGGPIPNKTPDEIADILAGILEMDREEIYEMITGDTDYVTIKRWVSVKQAEEVKAANLSGISVIEDNQRIYPYDNFASHILGFTNIDQAGMYGIESTYNGYLTGEPGRRIVNTDGNGIELPFDGFEQYYAPVDGLNVVLTIDEVIQHFAENAVEKAYYDNNAKSATMIIMNPNNGDILAMASRPSYDPNNPRLPYDETMKNEWSGLSGQDLQNEWYDLWRNISVNDIYEPGSTFKLLTTAIALEENKASMNSTYFCDGYVDDIITETPIKCWRYYNPHGLQTLAEALQNSCNDALADIGLAIGKETFYKYNKALGFGQRTNIALNGEAFGIVNSPETMRDVNLVTQAFGQGISVTPIQLVTAVGSLSNGGNLIKPRLVKQLVDNGGNIVHENPVEIVRKVFSEETSNNMMEIMESVVSQGAGISAYLPGYSVGGKTGTAQKVVNGKYSEELYVTSFIATAPTLDPEIVVLLIIDEPKDSYYGSVIAAPVVGAVIDETLKYMNVQPVYTKDEIIKLEKSYVIVPNVIGLSLKDASYELDRIGLKHNITLDNEEDILVKDQYPKEGIEVIKGSVITIMLN